VLRYVERNALRANLAARAQDWPWCRLSEWLNPPALPWLDPGPVGRGTNGVQGVNEPQTEEELARLRQSVEPGTPYGSAAWTQATAAALGLEFTLRAGGRPPGSGPAARSNETGLFG
jgi:putative transposase